MDLLVLSLFWPPRIGGVENANQALVAGLRAEGHRVAILAPVGAAPGLPCSEVQGVDPDRPRAASGAWHFLRAARAALARGRAQWVGVLHTAGCGPAAWVLSRLHGIPYFVLAYGMEVLVESPGDPRRAARAGLQRVVLRGAARVIAISQATADRLLAVGVEARRVHVIPPGIDVEGLSGRGDPAVARALRERHPGRLVALTVARLVERKGHDAVIEALRAVPGVVYVVVGEGPERDRLVALARQAGVVDRVEFLGRVDDPAAYYRAADVFVMPSRGGAGDRDVEGFGLAYAEAACFGLPSIAPAVGGPAEVVVAGETGWLVDPARPAQVARALREAAEDPGRRASMGERALARVRGRYGHRRAARDLARVLGESP
ncbi:MAG: glycosyltransferase family 4 protein [Planctomycetes bacterium]|nr:glycosyltransferase family 4 protein [Planctomycetota bacterium]